MRYVLSVDERQVKVKAGVKVEVEVEVEVKVEVERGGLRTTAMVGRIVTTKVRADATRP